MPMSMPFLLLCYIWNQKEYKNSKNQNIKVVDKKKEDDDKESKERTQKKLKVKVTESKPTIQPINNNKTRKRKKEIKLNFCCWQQNKKHKKKSGRRIKEKTISKSRTQNCVVIFSSNKGR